MSRKLLLLPLVLAMVVALVFAGAALAQGTQPPSTATPNQGQATPQGKGFGFNFRMPFGFGGGAGDWTAYDAVAKALNMSPTDLFNELHGGKTLAQIAQEKNVQMSAIQSAVNAVQAQAQQNRLDQALKNGQITQDQYNWLQQGLKNGWLGGHGFGGRMGPGMKLPRNGTNNNQGGTGGSRGFLAPRGSGI